LQAKNSRPWGRPNGSTLAGLAGSMRDSVCPAAQSAPSLKLWSVSDLRAAGRGRRGQKRAVATATLLNPFGVPTPTRRSKSHTPKSRIPLQSKIENPEIRNRMPITARRLKKEIRIEIPYQNVFVLTPRRRAAITLRRRGWHPETSPIGPRRGAAPPTWPIRRRPTPSAAAQRTLPRRHPDQSRNLI
jgi:hypothetical protein